MREKEEDEKKVIVPSVATDNRVEEVAVETEIRPQEAEVSTFFKIPLQKQLDIAYIILIGVIIGLFIMLYTGLLQISLEKELLFKYFEIYNKYDELNSSNLKNLIIEEKGEIKDLKGEIENLINEISNLKEQLDP